MASEIKNKGGLKKGQTNNPHGRPVGSKNKVKHTVKERIIEFVESDFDDYVLNLKLLSPKDRVKATTELIKLVVPRPMSDEEKDNANMLYGGLARLFGVQQE